MMRATSCYELWVRNLVDAVEPSPEKKVLHTFACSEVTGFDTSPCRYGTKFRKSKRLRCFCRRDVCNPERGDIIIAYTCRGSAARKHPRYE